MKPAAVRLLLSSFLLFSAFAAAALDPVLDIDGNELKRGAEYYVLPSLGAGGGLALASRNRTCPLNVARGGSGSSLGHPVAFLPYDGDATVRLMTDANFVFSAPAAACAQSTVWRLGSAEGATGRAYVATGGVAGTTGPRARSSWFRVEKARDGGDGYKLVFCPQPPVCRGCGKPRCGDLGLFAEGGGEWLVLGGDSRPFAVVFVKAHKCLHACT